MEKENIILTISGDPGSGKSTTIEALKKRYTQNGYKVKIFSIGKIFRDIAEQNGISVKKLNELQYSYLKPDETVDNQTKKFANLAINSKFKNQVYIFDARIAFAILKEKAINIKLAVEENEAGKRVFRDKNRNAEKKYISEEAATKDTKKRRQLEIDRYKKIYNIDIGDVENYDLLIDTTKIDVNGVAKIIAETEEIIHSSNNYAKFWSGSKMFYPTEDIRAFNKPSQEDIFSNIKNNGFNPLFPIDVVVVDEMKYIVDGHNRTLAAFKAKSPLGYNIVAKDDEPINSAGNTSAREFVGFQSTMSRIYDWEDTLTYKLKEDFKFKRYPLSKEIVKEQGEDFKEAR